MEQQSVHGMIRVGSACDSGTGRPSLDQNLSGSSFRVLPELPAERSGRRSAVSLQDYSDRPADQGIHKESAEPHKTGDSAPPALSNEPVLWRTSVRGSSAKALLAPVGREQVFSPAQPADTEKHSDSGPSAYEHAQILAEYNLYEPAALLGKAPARLRAYLDIFHSERSEKERFAVYDKLARVLERSPDMHSLHPTFSRTVPRPTIAIGKDSISPHVIRFDAELPEPVSLRFVGEQIYNFTSENSVGRVAGALPVNTLQGPASFVCYALDVTARRRSDALLLQVPAHHDPAVGQLPFLEFLTSSSLLGSAGALPKQAKRRLLAEIQADVEQLPGTGQDKKDILERRLESSSAKAEQQVLKALLAGKDLTGNVRKLPF